MTQIFFGGRHNESHCIHQHRESYLVIISRSALHVALHVALHLASMQIDTDDHGGHNIGAPCHGECSSSSEDCISLA